MGKENRAEVSGMAICGVFASARSFSTARSFAAARCIFTRAHKFLWVTVIWFTLSPFPFSPVPPCAAQEVVDKMVATVNAGVNPDCREMCLITYSDLLWQLALQPGTPLDNPTSADLNHALRLIIDQRLILQEAEKLPTLAPTDKEISDERDELVKEFTSQAELQQRMLK